MTTQSLRGATVRQSPPSKRDAEVARTLDTNQNRTRKMGSAKRVYRLVLTGGPCAGKTTGQNRLSDFFENLGWKVYRSPEAATVLLQGGIKFPELSKEDAFLFQENLIKSMIAIENTYFDIAETCPKNCIIICDRGIMDATAFVSLEEWDLMCKRNGWNSVDMRDNRYDQVIHMVSAAKGAEEYYTTEEHATRSEGVELARMRDDRASAAWVGHPYYDVVDNSTSFEGKLVRTISSVCHRLGIDVGDRLLVESKKRKFLIAIMPSDDIFPDYQDFEVIHDYLLTPGQKNQARLRKRGQHGSYTYTHTVRRHLDKVDIVGGGGGKEGGEKKEAPELKQAISRRDYIILLAQKDQRRSSIYKKRRCFIWNNHYYQLDVYLEPCQTKCRGLILLETYTVDSSPEFVDKLPSFLNILREVTGDSQYSMYNLALKDEGQEIRDIRRRIKSEGGPQALASVAHVRNRSFSNRSTSISSVNDDVHEDIEHYLATNAEMTLGSSAPDLSNGTSFSDDEDNLNCNETGERKGVNGHVANHATISTKKDDQIFLFPSLALPGRKRHDTRRRQRTYSESQHYGPVSDILEVCGKKTLHDSSSSGENVSEDPL